MGIRKRRARGRARTHIVPIAIGCVLAAMAALALCGAYAMFLASDSWLSDLPDYKSADAYAVSEPTTVYDSKGNEIASFYLQKRKVIGLSDMSPYVTEGTVDTEDIRFYQHNGIDPRGIARAVLVQLRGGDEGASTITQQLVRNTVLSDEQFEHSIRRKVREAYIAMEMEKEYSKNQILEMYLNTIYYGNNAYGIEAASITYFDKHASELTLSEAAALVGIPQSPSNYDPFTNPDAVVARRNTVLSRMLTAGDISQGEFDAASKEGLSVKRGEAVPEQSKCPCFTDYVRKQLSQDYSDSYIASGGLRVYTTLDPDAQEDAQRAVDDRLEEFGNDRLDCGLVAVDPSNGHVIAMIGGRDYESGGFNIATEAKRQAGSSFKTFTLAAAIKEGVSPKTYLDCGSPRQITPTWRVQNYGNTNYGTITLERATWVSSNTGYAQVASDIGADAIVETAHDMGISSELGAYPSITLGTEGVSVIDMAEAYSTLAADGVHRDAIVITEVEDRDGKVIYEHKDEPEEVLEPGVAEAVTGVLEGVISNSSGTAHMISRMWDVDQPVAGKTGTSEDFRDLWFCGYTPQVAVAIWTGYTEEGTVTDPWGGYGHPTSVAVPAFAEFANAYLRDAPREEFPSNGEEPEYKEEEPEEHEEAPEPKQPAEQPAEPEEQPEQPAEQPAKQPAEPEEQPETETPDQAEPEPEQPTPEPQPETEEPTEPTDASQDTKTPGDGTGGDSE